MQGGSQGLPKKIREDNRAARNYLAPPCRFIPAPSLTSLSRAFYLKLSTPPIAFSPEQQKIGVGWGVWPPEWNLSYCQTKPFPIRDGAARRRRPGPAGPGGARGYGAAGACPAPIGGKAIRRAASRRENA